jgi:hypothetical protein
MPPNKPSPGEVTGARRRVHHSGQKEIVGRNALSPADRQPVDPCLVFLLRAAVKFDLTEAGLQDPDAAIDDLEHALRVLRPCPCAREILNNMERLDRKLRKQMLMDWRWKR